MKLVSDCALGPSCPHICVQMCSDLHAPPLLDSDHLEYLFHDVISCSVTD